MISRNSPQKPWVTGVNCKHVQTYLAAGSAHELIVAVHLGSRNHECASPDPCSSLSYVAQDTKVGSYQMKHGLKFQDSGSFFPDPNTRSSAFARSERSSAISSFIMKCYGDRSNRGLKSFTTSVLYIIISDCRQTILIQRRCYGDSIWVSVAAWINRNEAVSLTACAVIGLIFSGFRASHWMDQLHGVRADKSWRTCSQKPLCYTAARHKQQVLRVALLCRDNPTVAPCMYRCVVINNVPKSSTLTLTWKRLPASTWSYRIVTSFTLFLTSNGTNCVPQCGAPQSPSDSGAKRAVFTLMQHDKHMQENWQRASVNEVPSLLCINYEWRIIAVGFSKDSLFGPAVIWQYSQQTWRNFLMVLKKRSGGGSSADQIQKNEESQKTKRVARGNFGSGPQMRNMYLFLETAYSITEFLFHALLVRLGAHYQAKSKLYALFLLLCE